MITKVIVACLISVGGYTSKYNFELVDGNGDDWIVRGTTGELMKVNSNQCLIVKQFKFQPKGDPKSCSRCHKE